jgi:hypothetical protein
MSAKSSKWGAYIDAVLRIEAPDRVIWVRPTPISRSTGQYPDPEGRTICVITAHNPGGQLAPTRRMSQLRRGWRQNSNGAG